MSQILVEIPKDGIRRLSRIGELHVGRVFMNAKILEISGGEWFEPPFGDMTDDEYRALLQDYRRKGFTVEEKAMD
jgi:hypothetical protein